MVQSVNWEVAMAFTLTAAAGMSTVIGACLALYAKIAEDRTLPIALGLSAGVLIYVSFAEVFLVKSVANFVEQGYEPTEAMRAATLCFFGGILLMAALSAIVHFICCRPNQVHSTTVQCPCNDHIPSNNGNETPLDLESGKVQIRTAGAIDHCHFKASALAAEKETQKHRRLRSSSLLSGVAIGLHNFPEGLATFAGTLSHPIAGIAIAIAIALHNIPEGIVVALPVYCATKSHVRALLWAFLAGAFEPLGALFGWLILTNVGDLGYAITFAIVAGTIVFIAVRELIPTALQFDPDDKYVTVSIFVGMAVVAGSLLLFSA